MKDNSIFYTIVTWLVLIALVLVGLTVIFKNDQPIDEPVQVFVDNSSVQQSDSYPCLAGDKCN